jgi:hypothetical protein
MRSPSPRPTATAAEVAARVPGGCIFMVQA